MDKDLTEAFAFYDKEETGYISIAHLSNILHNFGFCKMTKRDRDDELRRFDIDFVRRNCANLEWCRAVISYKWNKSGAQEEARDAFRLFDKRERDVITFKEIKDVLGSIMDIPVTDHDIEEFMQECDPNGNG